MQDRSYFEDRAFENERWEVDGLAFVRCKFKRCRLVFSGGDQVSFKDCTFADCDWVFDGPAENTLAYLSAMYHGLGPAGKQLVTSIFRGIEHGTFPSDRVEDAHELKVAVTR